MLYNLSQRPSVLNQFMAELRNIKVQNDSMRFRRNLERLGEIFAYEISKTFVYKTQEIETPLGIAEIPLPTQSIVLANILRAGLPMHQGFLNIFDTAENAFVSAYRKHHKDGSFEIKVEYVSCPSIQGKVLIVSDPMLATGTSMSASIKELLKYGTPKNIHIVVAIASTYGIEHIQRTLPSATIWTGAIDEELTARSYIVPGLGDAGDLAFGAKLQE